MELLISSGPPPLPQNARAVITPGQQGSRAFWPACRLLTILLSVVLGRCLAQNSTSNEYAVKALFLYNFAKFADWPPTMAGGPICIGVIGDDPFGQVLDDAVAGKTVNGRAFVVRRFKSEQDARQCHIVFVNLEKRLMRPALEKLKDCGVMTVGDARGFAEAGGVVNFLLVDDRVRFEINLDAAARAGLKFSSKLLMLAKIVHGEP
ncbi:MAG TPA: YfiR family protein [Bryobacteraceae bacterium]|nr:YfiR family protein [Bryobacteraceae bacterium]